MRPAGVSFRRLSPTHKKIVVISMVPTEGKWMARKQAVEFADFLAAIGRRSSNPGFELETIRDVTDNIHLATKQPEGVTYAEVDAGGVDALSCIPVDSDPESVLLHRLWVTAC
jgi:hypothetical protein